MTLKELRNQIDEIDANMIKLLEARLRIAEKIAEIKVEEGLPIENPEREAELLDGIEKNSSKDLAIFNRSVYEKILSVSKEHQGRIIEKE